MLTLQIKRLSTEIFEIYINNQLVRYLPRQKSDQLETSIHDYAAKNGVDSLLFFSLPQDEPLPLYLSPDNQAELRDILLYQQKKPIEFPDDLMLSKEKTTGLLLRTAIFPPLNFTGRIRMPISRCYGSSYRGISSKTLTLMTPKIMKCGMTILPFTSIMAQPPGCVP